MSVYPTTLRIALAATMSFATLSAAPAHAFADDDARRAILDLREQVHQITEQDRRIRLEFADQLEMMRHEIMSLRGEIEQLKWASDLERRASQDQSGGSSIQVGDPQEQAAYESPIALFRSGKYKEAADGFSLFLDAYPSSQLAPEARFYRGSSQYATKDFKASIAGLQELISTTPQDPRAADALLIIAASQIELDDLGAAKTSLQRIVKEYPETSAAQTATDRLKLL